MTYLVTIARLLLLDPLEASTAKQSASSSHSRKGPHPMTITYGYISDIYGPRTTTDPDAKRWGREAADEAIAQGWDPTDRDPGRVEIGVIGEHLPDELDRDVALREAIRRLEEVAPC